VRNQFHGRKRTSVALGMLLALAVAGGAFAYWTIGGTGLGTASTGNVVPITVNQTTDVTGLFPGDSQALAGDFDNGNSGPVWVSSVTATVVPFSDQSDPAKPACTQADFQITGTANVNGQVPVGSGVGAWSGLSVSMINKPDANQDNCKKVNIDIEYTAKP
jgi:hypothetical protein